jgi:hypothetical protein
MTAITAERTLMLGMRSPVEKVCAFCAAVSPAAGAGGTQRFALR